MAQWVRKNDRVSYVQGLWMGHLYEFDLFESGGFEPDKLFHQAATVIVGAEGKSEKGKPDYKPKGVCLIRLDSGRLVSTFWRNLFQPEETRKS